MLPVVREHAVEAGAFERRTHLHHELANLRRLQQ